MPDSVMDFRYRIFLVIMAFVIIGLIAFDLFKKEG